MEINEQTLSKIAHLARLNIDDQSKQELLDELNEMIQWVEKLHELDTDGVEPLTNMSQELNAWREDEVKSDINQEQALKNAPDKLDNYFRVPKFMK